MQQMGDIIRELIQQVRANQPNLCDWRELPGKKDSSETEKFKILTAASDKCIYGECDGTGQILVYDLQKGKEFVRFCRCREHLILETRLKFANIPEEFRKLTIASFRIDLYQPGAHRKEAAMAKRIAVNYVKNFPEMKEQGKGLYFYSFRKGSGKTRLAASLGNALLKMHKVSVKFITTIDLLNEIRQTFRQDGPHQSDIVDAIKRVDVLILDDIGTERQNPWVNEVFFNILNGRMESKRVTIFTSNAKIEDLEHDEKIVNRIERMAFPVYLPDESVRSVLARKENEKLQALLLNDAII